MVADHQRSGDQELISYGLLTFISASRFTASQAGFFDLIQCRERPEA